MTMNTAVTFELRPQSGEERCDCRRPVPDRVYLGVVLCRLCSLPIVAPEATP